VRQGGLSHCGRDVTVLPSLPAHESTISTYIPICALSAKVDEQLEFELADESCARSVIA